MWVVKLGGSLASSPYLKPWLGALAMCPEVVLVPGGGPFADQVRAAQRRWGFDDAAAHHMALLGMEQYGRMLCAMQPGLRPAASPAEIQRSLKDGATPVWMPVPTVVGEPEIEHNWDVTSDSLAAWLCRRLSAAGLLLIKSTSPASLSVGLHALVEQGIVDTAFPRYAERAGGSIHLLSREDLGRLDEVLQGTRDEPSIQI
ncbi:MAG: amino acid kinase [Chromatiaceae bacterium]|jgi:5-(aminomethyl)-3-furanmethanol phosphate kinase